MLTQGECPRSMAGAVILDIAYGIKVRPYGDPHIATAEGGLHAIMTIASLSAQIFDLFPASTSYNLHGLRVGSLTLTYPAVLRLPSWFPGAGVRILYAATISH